MCTYNINYKWCVTTFQLHINDRVPKLIACFKFIQFIYFLMLKLQKKHTFTIIHNFLKLIHLNTNNDNLDTHQMHKNNIKRADIFLQFAVSKY